MDEKQQVLRSTNDEIRRLAAQFGADDGHSSVSAASAAVSSSSASPSRSSRPSAPVPMGCRSSRRTIA